MKIELEPGDKRICLKLVAETPDERRMLFLLDGAQVNTVDLSTGMTSYLLSKPMALKEADPVQSAG